MAIDLDEAIEMWRRTVRMGMVRHSCRSIESHYRPPKWEAEEVAPDTRVPINYRLGWKAELAWRAIPQFRTRMLLSWHYVWNRHIDEAARRARIERRHAEFELSRARQVMRQTLDRLDRTR